MIANANNQTVSCKPINHPETHCFHLIMVPIPHGVKWLGSCIGSCNNCSMNVWCLCVCVIITVCDEAITIIQLCLPFIHGHLMEWVGVKHVDCY